MNNISGQGSLPDLKMMMLEGRLREAQQKMNGAQGKPADDARTKEAARHFESYLLEYLLNTMQKTVDAWRSDNGGQRDVYYSIINRNLAETLSQTGKFGIANMMMQHLASSAKKVSPEDLKAPEGPVPLSQPGSALPLHPASPMPLSSTGQEGETLAQPVAGGRISSLFGMRSDPFTGEHRFHRGMDYAVPEGTDVHSVQDGVVEWAGNRGSMGKTVIVRHANGLKTIYGHLSDLGVAEGDTVAAGQTIAQSGHTGRATGPHLHFEVRESGAARDPGKLAQLFSRTNDNRR